MRKPLNTVFHEYINDWFKESNMSAYEFGQKYGIKNTTLRKLLNNETQGLNSLIIDRILTNTGDSLISLLQKYGEYIDE